MGPGRDRAAGEDRARRRPGRVPTSCQECRRLKLRCDRQVPCETCVKRGCASICPDGSLTAGKGNRMVLANTEELHEKIDRLCSRVRELEDALRTLQSTISEQTHPLLRDDLLSLKTPTFGLSSSSSTTTTTTGARNESPPQPMATSSAAAVVPRLERVGDEDGFIDAFGTLTIGLKGESTFLGKTARSEYLIHAPTKPSPQTIHTFPHLSKYIIDASVPDMEITLPKDELGRHVFRMLPPLSEAVKLCDLYMEHGKYSWSPLPRSELFDVYLSAIYRTEAHENFSCWPSLALLFAVFALGALFDPARPPFSIESQEYYLLSRVALIHFTQPLFKTTVSSILTLVHLTQYLELSDWESTGSPIAWTYMGFATKLGTSIGLHLNGARWNLDEISKERRDRVFWQLFTQDTWLSFSFGRPPSLNPAFIDCTLPKDLDEYTNNDGGKELGFHTWTWQYTRLLHNVMTSAFGAKMPPYSMVLKLDRKIRDFPVPKYLQPNCDNQEDPTSPDLIMQRWIVLSSKEATLLNLHRTYFAQALHEQPNDLLRHRYGPSVMATYRSAWRLIEGLKSPSRKVPDLLSRYSLAWSQDLSAAIVMCLFVTRAPSSSLASSCLEELEKVEKLFTQAAPNCRAAANSLESIKKLHLKGREALHQHQGPEPTLTPAELDHMNGKTHLIAEEVCPSPPPLSSSSSSNPSPPSDSSLGVASTAAFVFDSDFTNTDNIHPRIIQDMKAFDAFDMSSYNLQTHCDEFLFDLPPESAAFPQTMTDIQYQDTSIYGGDLFNQPAMQRTSGIQQIRQLPATTMNGFSPGPPVLDATWQSFVEQLGF